MDKVDTEIKERGYSYMIKEMAMCLNSSSDVRIK